MLALIDILAAEAAHGKPPKLIQQTLSRELNMEFNSTKKTYWYSGSRGSARQTTQTYSANSFKGIQYGIQINQENLLIFWHTNSISKLILQGNCLSRTTKKSKKLNREISLTKKTQSANLFKGIRASPPLSRTAKTFKKIKKLNREINSTKKTYWYSGSGGSARQATQTQSANLFFKGIGPPPPLSRTGFRQYQ